MLISMSWRLHFCTAVVSHIKSQIVLQLSFYLHFYENLIDYQHYLLFRHTASLQKCKPSVRQIDGSRIKNMVS